MTLSRHKISQQAARSLLGRQKDAALTYTTVGMSLGRVAAPEGFREFSTSAVVGTGEQAYRNIGYALMHWDVFTAAKLRVQPIGPAVREGDAVAVAVHSAPFLSTVGACRVVEVVATGRSTGFAYGTLPNHPVVGEESFVLTHRDDDKVELAIRSFSKPNAWYVRLAGPLGRGTQHRVAKRTLAAAARLATVEPVAEARTAP